MLSLHHGVPVLAAGIHEGKNEIVARIDYHHLGINLRTETPTSNQIERGAERIWSDPVYRKRLTDIKMEFTE